MNQVLSKAMIDWFIALGVVLGGSMLAGIGAVLAAGHPTSMMNLTAERLKIWAIVAAVGGTIDPIRVIEHNMIEGHLSPVAQQICYIVSAFLGAHVGTELVRWICREGL